MLLLLTPNEIAEKTSAEKFKRGAGKSKLNSAVVLLKR